jgi:hypothetical protein
MGFHVHAVVTLSKPPNEALMSELDHKFEVATHATGTKLVDLTEHVSTPDEADALAFVRALVLDALPPGSTIREISATPD